MATMVVQPTALAAMTAARPTEPQPKMAMLEPAGGLSALMHRAGAGLDAAGERTEQLQRHVGATLTVLASFASA